MTGLPVNHFSIWKSLHDQTTMKRAEKIPGTFTSPLEFLILLRRAYLLGY